MPISCKCTLDHLKYKGAITEKEYDKLLRNLKGTVWHPYPDEKPTESKEYPEKSRETNVNVEEVLQTLEKLYNDFTMRPDECKALDFAIKFIKEKNNEESN